MKRSTTKRLNEVPVTVNIASAFENLTLNFHKYPKHIHVGRFCRFDMFVKFFIFSEEICEHYLERYTLQNIYDNMLMKYADFVRQPNPTFFCVPFELKYESGRKILDAVPKNMWKLSFSELRFVFNETFNVDPNNQIYSIYVNVNIFNKGIAMNTVTKLCRKKFTPAFGRIEYKIPSRISNEEDSDESKSVQYDLQAFEIPLLGTISDYTDTLEDFFILFYNLYSNTYSRLDLTSVILNCVSFAKCRMKSGSFIKSTFATTLSNYISQYLDFNDRDITLQSYTLEEFFSTSREYLEKFKNFRTSKFFRNLNKLFLFVMSYVLYAGGKIPDFIKRFNFMEEAFYENLQKKSIVDILHSVAESVLFICEKGYQVFKNKSVKYMFHSSTEYGKLHDRCMNIILQSKCLHNPEAFDFSEQSFRQELELCLLKLNEIKKFKDSLSSSELTEVNKLLMSLNMINIDLITYDVTSNFRKAPFAILLCGDTSIGKTSIRDILFYYFAHVAKLPNEKSHMYIRNPNEEFWNGMKTHKWCIVIDDAAFFHPNKCMNVDPTTYEVIPVINSSQLVVNMASIEEKGKIAIKPDLVIATSNVEDLNAHFYYSNPSAVLRRFPYIVVAEVKPQFRREGTKFLDSTKVPLDEGYPDVWHFTIKQAIPAPYTGKIGNAPQIKEIAHFNNMSDFLQWYKQVITEFRRNQDIVFDSVHRMQNAVMCSECDIPITLCQHKTNACEITLQSDIMNHSKLIWFMFKVYLQFLFGHPILSVIVSSSLLILLGLLTLLFFLGFSFISMLFIIMAYAFLWFRRTFIKIEINDSNRDLVIAEPKIGTGRLLFTLAGERINKMFGAKPSLTSIATAITCALATFGGSYYLYKKFLNIDYDLQSSEREPKPKQFERPNVWYNENLDIETFAIPRRSRSYQGLTKEHVIKILSKNVANIHFRYSAQKVQARGIALHISDGLYLFNSHTIRQIRDGDVAYIDLTFSGTQGVRSYINILITEKDIIRIPKHDFALVRIKSVPVRRDITDLIVRDIPQNIRCDSALISKRNGDPFVFFGGAITKSYDTSYLKELLPNFSGSLYKVTYDSETEIGDCGSPLVAFTPSGPTIVGIHVARARGMKDTFSVALTYDILEPYLSKKLVDIGEPLLQSSSDKFDLGPLHPKSPFRYISDGSAEIFGSNRNFRPSPKSRVCSTPIQDFLKTKKYTVKYGAPIMTGWEPWLNNIEHMVKPLTDFRSDIIQKCVESYISIFNKFPKEQLREEIHVVPMKVAINGYPGISYIDSVNRSTSAGFPFYKSKRFFIEHEPPDDIYADPITFSQEILDRASKMESDYKEGRRCYPVFVAHLKDEAISYEKIMGKLTRLFTGAPIDWTLTCRKYSITLIRFIQNNKFAFETAVGTVAQSMEWTYLYKHITKYGENRIVAGDYSKFDKKMPATFILAAFDILIHLAELSGNFDEEDITLLRCLAHDVAFPVVDVNGDLVMFYGSEPSGHPLTVIINSIVNSLYLRYAYYILNPERECITFRDNVSLITYGDDNIMSVNKMAPWFNHTAIVQAFATVGIKYTMADKLSESKPYIHISEATFLKRRWRFDEHIGAYMAPLEHDSIEKSLMVWVKSRSVSSNFQIQDVVASAVREYFYYGKDVFEKRSAILKEALDSLDIPENEKVEESIVFPDYDYLILNFLTNSEKLQLQSQETYYDESYICENLDENSCYCPDTRLLQLYSEWLFGAPLIINILCRVTLILYLYYGLGTLRILSGCDNFHLNFVSLFFIIVLMTITDCTYWGGYLLVPLLYFKIMSKYIFKRL